MVAALTEAKESAETLHSTLSKSHEINEAAMTSIDVLAGSFSEWMPRALTRIRDDKRQKQVVWDLIRVRRWHIGKLCMVLPSRFRFYF